MIALCLQGLVRVLSIASRHLWGIKRPGNIPVECLVHRLGCFGGMSRKALAERMVLWESLSCYPGYVYKSMQGCSVSAPLLCHSAQVEPDLELGPWLRWSRSWSLQNAIRKCCIESDEATLNGKELAFLSLIPTRLGAVGLRAQPLRKSKPGNRCSSCLEPFQIALIVSACH